MLLTLGAYLAGVLVSAVITRGGTPDWWRTAIRVQVGATAMLLSFVAAWRLDLGAGLVGVVALLVVIAVMSLAAQATRGDDAPGEAALDTWAAMPNTSFWVVPMAAAIAGPAAAAAAVLADRLTALPTGVLVHLMRRDAPRPQRVATSWIDQAPVLALLGGLVARAGGAAPTWTTWVLGAAGPVLAFSGAVLWMGSIRQLITAHGRSSPPRVRSRFLMLTGIRVAGGVTVAALLGRSSLAVVAALWAGSVPSFGPALSTDLYGYPGRVAAFAARWAWLAAPPGLLLAVLVAP